MLFRFSCTMTALLSASCLDGKLFFLLPTPIRLKVKTFAFLRILQVAAIQLHSVAINHTQSSRVFHCNCGKPFVCFPCSCHWLAAVCACVCVCVWVSVCEWVCFKYLHWCYKYFWVVFSNTIYHIFEWQQFIWDKSLFIPNLICIFKKI